MHCFHCREAVQLGCNLSPMPTPLPGRRFLLSHSPTMQAAGNLKWASIRSKAQWVRAPGPPIFAFTSTKVARANLYKWGISSQMGSSGSLLVTMSGNPVRNASHKLKYGGVITTKICFQLFLNSQNQNYYTISTDICEIQRKIPTEFLLLEFQWLNHRITTLETTCKII